MVATVYEDSEWMAEFGAILLFASIVQLPFAIIEGSVFATGVHLGIIVFWLLWFDQNVYVILDRRKIKRLMEVVESC